ncbi:MAG: NAD+ synthase [Candidatus Saelkia tenebricola]|nr:NAD+ synthase [Candidatus Saelkia tenebricola]
MKILRFAIAQINPVVGDLGGNQKKILNFIERASRSNPDVIVFPEFAITGCPPEDLLLKSHFIKDCKNSLKEILKKNKFPGVLILGYVEEFNGEIYNSAAIISKNRTIANYRKIKLPNCGVFDEKRYFTSGTNPVVLVINGIKVGITIYEDIWADNGFSVLESLKGVDTIINISASGYYMGRIKQRIRYFRNISKKYDLNIISANIVGGQDELVFDGASMVVSYGEVKAMAAQFKEDILIYESCFEKTKRPLPKCVKQIKLSLKDAGGRKSFKLNNFRLKDEMNEVYSALLLGTRDYVKKNGFKKAVIGLSGGIDSALTAVIAVSALGRDNIVGVAMPSMYSRKSSLNDAKKLAKNLGIKFMEISITDIYKSYLRDLRTVFKNMPFNETEENIQARIRGNILMALSNKFGYLVLTTGNKSEVSTGYCTLYGDMAGGFAMISDVTKTLEYKLAKWINEVKATAVIPNNILIKPPSAELRPNQKDQDTLPEYEVLDGIMLCYIEKNMSFEEIVKAGYNKSLVKRVIRMIDNNEYKRRQAPPGIKITPKAFGKDRKMPLTCGYKI